MPDISYRKRKPNVPPPGDPQPSSGPPYVELLTTTNFSFLRGASHPEEFVSTAAKLGYRGIGIADCNTLAGIVRGHIAAKEYGLQYIVGARLELLLDAALDDLHQSPLLQIAAYPTDRKSYGRLCRLLTLGKRRVEKGHCLLALDDLLHHLEGLILILIPPNFSRHYVGARSLSDSAFAVAARTLRDASRHLSLAMSTHYLTSSFEQRDAVRQLSQELAIPLIATNDAFYHTPERRMLQDVLTCIRHGCTITQAGFRLFENAERYLKPAAEMWRLFREMPEAVQRTTEIAEQLKHFSLDQLRYEYPNEICPAGETPHSYLTQLVWQGAAERYPHGIPDKVRAILEEELGLIAELRYAKYFLTCYDIVKFARSRGILCQGRGAAANSAVCYCLGITSVDPERIQLLFARFVSKERDEPPDIDIDFEHERREEVIQYIYQKYGRERAGLTATVITYRQRSAVREVGKALGLPLETVDALAKSIHRWIKCQVTPEELEELGLSPTDPTVQRVFSLSSELLGFPRHLSQHVGGFVICEGALCETVPIMNAAMEDRTTIEWDKDDIEALGMLKIDVLGLGILSCIRKALALINERRAREAEKGSLSARPPIELHTVPKEDPHVYDMICRADTIGVFQIESRAQMSMLPRLKPRSFYDLVIEVAIVRPGPVHGDMVHPFLRRRSGLEKAHYPDIQVREILEKTEGVPLFQEQAMRLAIVLAQFTPGEAEQLRRAMAAWKRSEGMIAKFKEKVVAGMVKNGYSVQFAETCMNQIKGFAEYGFPESHAASFAVLVYVSAWIKCHYPAEFAASLINSQPMGFYTPAQIIDDAKRHGVEVRPIDVNYSEWDCTIEPTPAASSKSGVALRLGMRLIKGMREEEAHKLRERFPKGTITSVRDLITAVPEIRKATLERLAHADAFQSLRLTARQALWEVKALPTNSLPLDPLFRSRTNDPVSLPKQTLQQSMFADYSRTGLSLKAHPMQFVREALTKRGIVPAGSLKGKGTDRSGPSGWYTKGKRYYTAVAGIATVRQRPGTARGVVFVTLEDETGVVNLIVRPEVFEKYYKIIISSGVILGWGYLERLGEVLYLNVERVESGDREVFVDGAEGIESKSYSY